jgi:hypothetical protein
MSFQTCIITGLRGTFQLSNPPPRFAFSRASVDTLEDAWHSDRLDNTTLTEGSPHPLYPGLILDQARFVEEVPESEPGTGSYTVECAWLGNARSQTIGEGPTKTLSRGKRRTIEAGWDERTVRYLSWHAAWKACTGDAGSNVITCAAHGFPNGKRVYFARLSGGAGLVPQSDSSLGVGYYVINRTSNTFQVSTSVGGGAVDFTSTMTAGEVIAGEFALGSPHPSYPYMHLCELTVQDDNNDWAIADCVYRGYEEAKPYHRMITVNGQQFSSSEPITISLIGGWNDPRNTNFHLPEVVVTDTYLVGTGTLPTGSVPSFGAPANAPFIPNYVITDSEIDNLTYNYPYGWTIVSTPHQATLNSQISAMVYQVVYRWIWPVLFR